MKPKKLILLCFTNFILLFLGFSQVVPDKIYTKDEKSISCKVSRQDEENVYYKLIGEEKEYNIKKTLISLIVYSDGDNQIFHVEPDKVPIVKKERSVSFKTKDKESQYKEPFVVKNKFVIKPGVGIGNTLDMFNMFNPMKENEWKYFQGSPSISINIDFGIGNKLSLGPVMSFVNYRFERTDFDSLYKFNVNYFCLGFQCKYYPELKWNRLRPYLRIGMNYYSESHEYLRYQISVQKEPKVIEKDNDIYVGWISMLGVDFMLNPSFGLYAEGGWATSYFIGGILLKF